MKYSTHFKLDKVTYLPAANKKANRASSKKILYFLIILAVCYFFSLFVLQQWGLIKYRRTLNELEQQIMIVREQNEEMKAELERLHSPAYLEKLARQDLGMVRSGELLFFFQPANNLQPEN